MFPTFEIFGRVIGMYGVMTVIGGVFCVLVGLRLIKKFDIKFEDFVLVIIAAAVGVVIFAHIVYGISNIGVVVGIIQNFGILGFDKAFSLLVACFGGMVFYGGFIGGAVGIVVYCKFSKILVRDEVLDIYAVLIPLFHTFGRIGCFLGGCCYGVESEFGFTAHGNTLNPSVNDVNRFPIQLLEASLNLVIFFVIWYLFRKGIMEKKLIFVYMLLYPPVRFTLEFFRGDTYRGFFLGLSTSQWISIILLVFSVVMLLILSRKKKKPQTATVTE